MRQNMTPNCLNYNSLSDTDLLTYHRYYDLKNQLLFKKHKKQVSFYNDVYLMLIPSIKDYQDANLCNDLWWSKNDLARFLKQYKFENINSKVITKIEI
jgi:hypothetical protein